jgi:signal transduction histidine kinase/CheY-like chemotaxis protein
MVWDSESAMVPAEWERLSPEPALPPELCSAGRSVEQELENGSLPMIGPLLGLRRAMWVPIERRGRLQGVLLAGSRSKHGELPKELFECAADRLALALELEEEQQRSRERQGDLSMTMQMLGSLSGGMSGATSLSASHQAGENRSPNAAGAEALLGEVVESCTASGTTGRGLGAIFAGIGAVPEDSDGRELLTARRAAEFRWKSGDSVWSSAMENAPAEEVWRRAMETRRTASGSPDLHGMRDKVEHIVAVPLQAEGKLVGVLAAGFAGAKFSPPMVERVELRARVAAIALGIWKRNAKETRQEAWRKTLLDRSGAATILLERSGRIAALNAGALSLLNAGLARESGDGADKVGQPLMAIFQASDQSRMGAWCELLLSGKDERSSEHRGGPQELPEAVLGNGARVRVRPAMPVGGPYAVVVLEKWRDAEMRSVDSHAERELQGVLEWLEEGVILFDAEENVRALNTRFLQMTGLSGSDAADLGTLEGLIFKLSERVAEPWSFSQRWRNLARGIDGGIREELELVKPAARILQRMARPILDGNGRRIGRVEIYRDLTARGGFQSKMLRTEKLAALGQLITAVAHELNNPLTSIVGYSQRLLETGLNSVSADEKRQVRQIFEEAERAAAILRQLLLNAHQSTPQLRAVSLNQLVLQGVDLQRVTLAQENIRVEMDLDANSPLVYGDAGQLQQVLMNLTGNARQALEQTGKGGTIRIRTKQIGTQRVLLEIADNGPGIPAENLGRIFDPFFTTKPAGSGTGLGLAIVMGIIQEHGGHVNVASPPNSGAIFSIALRSANAESQLDQPLKTGVAAGSGTTRGGHFSGYGALPESAGLLRTYLGGTLTSKAMTDEVLRSSKPMSLRPGAGRGNRRILVVEDEPTVARLIADVLEDEGFCVEVLLDGKEALKQAERETYDLVVCDMKMPGLDGQHFYKALVQKGNSLSERFLFVTGDVVSVHTHDFLEMHGVPHVAKPFRMEELKEKVHGLLERGLHVKSRAAEGRENG